MNPYLIDIEKYSYPLYKTDLNAKTDEDFIKINQRDQADIEKTQKNFEKLANERIELERSWSSFVLRIRGIEGFLKVTDRTPMAFTYSFKVEVVLQDNFGIGFCLSQIGKVVGIYFTSQKINALIPFKEFTSSVGGLSKVFINPSISYFPYSEIQIESANQLIEISREFFPDFQLFDNYCASDQIEDLVIDGRSFYKSELFQVLFADNLVVI
jgi:hypothetical protein